MRYNKKAKLYKFSIRPGRKNQHLSKLSHEDSNLDRQNQNLLYYLYTMGQKGVQK